MGIEWSHEYGPVTFVPDQINGIPDPGGAGSAKAQAKIQNIGSGTAIGVDSVAQGAAIGIFIGTLWLPGPEDVIFAAVAARYGLTSLKVVNGALYQGGKRLEGDELAKATELLKRTSDEYIENGGKLLDDEAWQLSQLRKLSDEAPKGTLIGKLDDLTNVEKRFVEDLLAQGKKVEIVPTAAGRTPDFVIDGVRYELKTLSGVVDETADGISGAIANRVMNGRGQATDIIVDARNQAGITGEIARRGVRRAFGADNKTGGKITSITIHGPGWTIVVPRI